MEKPVLTWDSGDVGNWLDCIGLSKYKEHFRGELFVIFKAFIFHKISFLQSVYFFSCFFILVSFVL